MWGMRVVVPQVYQQKVLEVLHGGHLGVVKMKALACSHVWWPHIDKEIEGVTQLTLWRMPDDEGDMRKITVHSYPAV